MAADPQGPPRRVSPWALATLVCGLSFFCPAAPLLGLVLGVVALMDLRRRPGRGGARMAAAGILASVLGLAGWTAAARWWDVHARRPMLEGPLPELAFGLAGDVARFQAGFRPDGPAPNPDETAAFLDEVGRRYGRLIGSSQKERKEASGASEQDGKGGGDTAPADYRRPRINYTFHFESGAVDADAEFVVTAAGTRGLVLKFSWLVFRDRERGDLCYPAAAAAEAGARPGGDATP